MNPIPGVRKPQHTDFKPGDLAFINGDRRRFSCVVIDECSRNEWEAYERSGHPKNSGSIVIGAAVVVLSWPEDSSEIMDLTQVRVTDGKSVGWVNVYVLVDPRDVEEVTQG